MELRDTSGFEYTEKRIDRISSFIKQHHGVAKNPTDCHLSTSLSENRNHLHDNSPLEIREKISSLVICELTQSISTNSNQYNISHSLLLQP